MSVRCEFTVRPSGDASCDKVRRNVLLGELVNKVGWIIAALAGFDIKVDASEVGTVGGFDNSFYRNVPQLEVHVTVDGLAPYSELQILATLAYFFEIAFQPELQRAGVPSYRIELGHNGLAAAVDPNGVAHLPNNTSVRVSKLAPTR